MACPITGKYPRKRPPGHKLPVPRWQLVFPPEVDRVHTLYLGIQSHKPLDPALATATSTLIELIQSSKPDTFDSFITETESGHDIPTSRVWALYFLDESVFNSALATLAPLSLVQRFGSSVGIWIESFTTPLSRLETNYAGLHESPGLANLPGAKRERHELSAYWGAARDRIPASAEDLFEVPGTSVPDAAKETAANDTDGELNGKPNGHHDEVDGNTITGATPSSGMTTYDDKVKSDVNRTPSQCQSVNKKAPYHPTDALVTTPPASSPAVYPSPSEIPTGLGQRLTGSSYHNMTHIRSGQCWAQCPPDEAAAYERPNGLQSKLMRGMTYLWEHAGETGTLGLRWLRNLDPTVNTNHTTGTAEQAAGTPTTINETCGAGFFRNLKDLENWSSSHPSHMAIFTGSHQHAREWGPDRKFMTWHEVSVLKQGEARWEYVNCSPKTGVIRWVVMDGVEKVMWD